jgi:DNA-binding CsgD family transcriptional regulator
MRGLKVTADDGDDPRSRAAGGVAVIAGSAPPGMRPHEVIPPCGAREVGADLSARELEVLSLRVAGRSTPALVRCAVAGHRPPRDHVQSIINKLGPGSRLEAVAIPVRGGPRPDPDGVRSARPVDQVSAMIAVGFTQTSWA